LGAQFADSGRAALAYNIDIFDAFQKSLVGPLGEFKMYVYPPVAMLLSWPLAKLPFLPALMVWTAIGMAFCLWSYRVCSAGRWRRWRRSVRRLPF
jgi:hypothetical protein